jgi:hypothetical protein
MNWEKIFGPRDPRSYGEYVKKPSPDKTHILVFDPGIEVRMMMSVYQFRLINAASGVVEAFEGLEGAMQDAWWTSDSTMVAIPVSDRRDGLLLFRVHSKRYSFVPFNSYQQTARLTTRGVWIAPDLKEFRGWFGDQFRPPDPIHFPFASLRWFPVVEKWKNLDTAVRVAPPLRWLPPPSKELKAYARKKGITVIW